MQMKCTHLSWMCRNYSTEEKLLLHRAAASTVLVIVFKQSKLEKNFHKAQQYTGGHVVTWDHTKRNLMKHWSEMITSEESSNESLWHTTLEQILTHSGFWYLCMFKKKNTIYLLFLFPEKDDFVRLSDMHLTFLRWDREELLQM